MKTSSIKKCVAILLFATIVCINNTAMAQIKVVDNSYAENLSATKSYYDRDVDFEKYFPSVSKSHIYPYSSMYPSIASNYTTNFVGDTIYICEPLSLDIIEDNNTISSWMNNVDEDNYPTHSFILQNDKAKCGKFVVPSGYYLISGYVFCDDNEDALRSQVGLKPFNGTHTCRELKKEILNHGSGFDYKDFSKYQRLLALKPLNGDTVTTYYLYFCRDTFSKMMKPQAKLYFYSVLQRFYNQIAKFIGKEIYLVQKGDSSRGTYGQLEIIDGDIMDDGITKDPVRLEDMKFTVQDVVLKKNEKGRYLVYIVLNGEKTGAFTQRIDCIRYAFSESDITYAYSYDDYNGPNKIKDIPILVCNKYIIRCSDLKIIKQRTYELKAQREQEIKQQEAKEEAALARQMVTKFGAEYGELIAKKQISVGMTKEMCKAAWGHPMNTYRTTTRFGQSEVWCYNYKSRVYFFDGKVVQIDE